MLLFTTPFTMKIRLYKDSVRLRLAPSELELLAKGENVTEAFQWGNDVQINFELIPGEDIACSVTSDKSTWQISWTKSDLLAWHKSDDEGLYHKTNFTGNGYLKISIEKDFACSGREGEEEKDRFPNPNKEAC